VIIRSDADRQAILARTERATQDSDGAAPRPTVLSGASKGRDQNRMTIEPETFLVRSERSAAPFNSRRLHTETPPPNV
jgi:hypothetical protein